MRTCAHTYTHTHTLKQHSPNALYMQPIIYHNNTDQFRNTNLFLYLKEPYARNIIIINLLKIKMNLLKPCH